MESVALALPVLLAIMAFEYYLSKKRGKKYFHFPDTISNLSIGIIDRLCSLLFAGIFFFVYEYLQKNFSIFDIQPTALNWIIMFVFVDFLWYWYHRFGHEVNIFWAAHIVHHSSKEFNYAVGSRTTILQSFVRLLFWCVLPIIGFTAPMIVLMLLVHAVYQFFTHTQLVGKLGFLEYFMVTPSHHRVHHGSNEKYLDKNYGGTFIIWDRLFGTFAEETEKVKFGLTKPLQSQSLIWQLFHAWVELFIAVRSEKIWHNKIKILFGKPHLIDPNIRKNAEKTFLSGKSKGKISQLFTQYIACQIAFSLLALILLLYFSDSLKSWETYITVIGIVLTLINCGAIMEQRQWVFHLEFARFVLIVAAAGFYDVRWIFPGVVILSICLIYYSSLQKLYFSRYLASSSLKSI
ncbi:MAG: sterol desaturase family protein [Cytophagales bacterium]